MKKIFLVFVPLLLLASACTEDISQLNIETKRPAAVPAPTLFSNAVKTISGSLASPSVNTNVFRFTVSHWAMSTYQDEAQYDFATRNIPQGWWTSMYRDVIADLRESAKLINADASLLPAEKANKLAIIDIMEVYTYSILVNTFGNIPYSESLNPAILFPKYDDAKTVSTDLINRLNADITKINTSAAGFASAEDLIYKGSVAKWLKFANTLRMKIGMVQADVDANVAKSAVEASDAGAISSAADNGLFTYMAASPNQNPLYVDIVLGGRSDYIAAKDLMDKLLGWNDPRTSAFFTPNNAGVYAGGIVGKGNTYVDFSRAGTKIIDASAPCVLADYVETEFLRAEAKERGFNVAGTAESHYNNAIRASIIYWGGSAADADAYLAQASVAYTTAAGDWKQKIGTQKWIALYNRPYEGWVELRRLDQPKISAPVGAKSGFPTRLTYAANEQTLNGTNYTAAASAIGGDVVTTKLYWDKF
ncbi:SusD/RagB family nutrient-binding outer membrane lipoprotein [Aquirufa ecclesiirivi]|uniref:SusD/RagB family nutrient-binding outer membrane lipoprotein n=1 Tax=Aquirufa ecclesiirivi TaxID=2715124 RepID=A0ABT4JGL4_9BACT|nr:SusD/RagB family nutrient-binding outer membrane lipoprotein [Aquirufa ecclesiirivi]MCZ2472663.1 SusD/RagB family nutrient-binding outer membrane lipoprotein [Aquirufa ecclesiirivi]MCZ2475428.1 SusD/RagB family nutrient-binding outer membrane lipoprotein [Aquirufa ecclesiirivi]MDF0694230.1 SusD/RagB family nutrient-binding outer membrane lipoprotein [Aquirufa ecclesiirivi]